MRTRCPLCYHWTPLPAHYPASHPAQPACESCGTALPAAAYRHRYLYCRVCRHSYLAEYGACPVCPAPTDLALTLAWQHLWLDAAPPPAPAPLSDRYCVDLWQSYQQEQAGARDRVQGGPSKA